MDSLIEIDVEEIKKALRTTGKFKIVEKPQKWLTVTSIHVKIVHSDGGSRHLTKLIYIANENNIEVTVGSDALNLESDPRSLFYSVNIRNNSNVEKFIKTIGEAKWL